MASGSIKSTFTVVWANPALGSPFAAQRVNVDLSKYSLVGFTFLAFHSITNVGWAQCPVGCGTNLFYGSLNDDTASSVLNSLNFTNRHVGTTSSYVEFGDAQMTYNGGYYGPPNWNNRSVPWQIWGIK